MLWLHWEVFAVDGLAYNLIIASPAFLLVNILSVIYCDKKGKLLHYRYFLIMILSKNVYTSSNSCLSNIARSPVMTDR